MAISPNPVHRNTEQPCPSLLSVRVRKAAAITGLSVSLLYKLMAEGKLPFSQIGGLRLISVKDLEAFLAATKAEA